MRTFDRPQKSLKQICKMRIYFLPKQINFSNKNSLNRFFENNSKMKWFMQRNIIIYPKVILRKNENNFIAFIVFYISEISKQFLIWIFIHHNGSHQKPNYFYFFITFSIFKKSENSLGYDSFWYKWGRTKWKSIILTLRCIGVGGITKIITLINYSLFSSSYFVSLQLLISYTHIGIWNNEENNQIT